MNHRVLMRKATKNLGKLSKNLRPQARRKDSNDELNSPSSSPLRKSAIPNQTRGHNRHEGSTNSMYEEDFEQYSEDILGSANAVHGGIGGGEDEVENREWEG